MARRRAGDVSGKRINLALQGGGAHGAFTWGVLDRLLEEEAVEIAGISGTSAGALNGAALKAGLLAGGRDGARENLDWLWAQMGAVEDFRLPGWMAGRLPGIGTFSDVLELSPVYTLADAASRAISPYAYGPFYVNPLRRVVDRFAYDKVCKICEPQFFVGATNVHTGKIRVFEGDAITSDSLLASACLPTLFQAVEIDGAHYWDGGYSGNPALFPLYRKELPDDIVVVNINPLLREEVPKSPQEIQNRINEISFNAALLRELRAVHFVQGLIDAGTIAEGAMKRVRVHMIADDDLMRELSVATKLVPSPLVLDRLKRAGMAAAERFLETDFEAVGTRDTVDLKAMFG
ncbi:Patatin-like phospholipase [Roseovarius sp. THAF9]|uniref:patatin-like phospholipase family protein n=1 Tax=Roseovarius sp. THAF9 TaxID=2587847 RepID=UPI001267A16D|nr:patatin-like phospholipase family protein [Roseovarius sp. THAF9]QFT93000.1 Patatin-like phospholipase [Roseovarius sp. THAF9]